MTKTIAVTGAAGNIAYALLFRLAAGAVYGDEQIRIRLLEIPDALPKLDGVMMELADSAFPALESVEATSDPRVAFDGVDAALLIGAAPRGPGMDRSDLLRINGEIFSAQGAAIGEVAASDVKVVVTGNPANTNALIAAHHAVAAGANRSADRGPAPTAAQFTALTRLDHNRALSQLAAKTGVRVAEIENLTIWGNHSNTQFPDITYATASGRALPELIGDDAWVADEFIPTVATRGGAIIKARGASSAASAASATLDHLRDWERGTDGAWVSMAVPSNGEYGVPAELVSSFPCTVSASGEYSIVEGLTVSEAQQQRIDASAAELAEERDTAAGLGRLG